MAHLPEKYGSFPLILRDYDILDPKKGELLFNYNSNELYFVKPQNGEVISMARDIYNKILAAKIKNTGAVIYDADKLSPLPGKDDIVPPIKDRNYNSIYNIILSRKTYVSTNNPLTAPTWAVVSGTTFYGKNSGYTEDDNE